MFEHEKEVSDWLTKIKKSDQYETISYTSSYKYNTLLHYPGMSRNQIL